MVRAINENRKTATRRLIKPQPERVRACFGWSDNKQAYEFACDGPTVFYKPPYLPGDILWVRETWKQAMVDRAGGGYALEDVYLYKADMPEDTTGMLVEGRWHPSIHMPRAAARIFLRVTEVGVERLQDITEEGVFQEGITEEYADNIAEPDCEHTIYFPDSAPGPCWVCDPCKKCPYYFSYPELFGWFVWNKTIKPADFPRYGWVANPWVWVIKFEKLQSPIKGFYVDSDTAKYGDNPVLAPAT